MPAAATCIIVDQHPAPLDPNFTGAGRTVTDKNGYYKFITVKPGAYPWGNHHNAWRPNHIHFSVFGHSFLSRLVTQMYFPGDYLFPYDPIFNSVTDEKARAAHGLDLRSRKHDSGLGAVPSASTSCCAAAKQTPPDLDEDWTGFKTMSEITPSQTVGPFYAYGLTPKGRCELGSGRDATAGRIPLNPTWSRLTSSGNRIHIEGVVFDGDGVPINRLHDRNLAGRQPRPLRQRSAGQPRAAELAIQGLRPFGDRQGRACSPFDTVKPGPVPGPGGKPQAPHIMVCIFSRGMMRQVYTRMYFDDEAANASDPILNPGARRSPRHPDREEAAGQQSGCLPLRHAGSGRRRNDSSSTFKASSEGRLRRFPKRSRRFCLPIFAHQTSDFCPPPMVSSPLNVVSNALIITYYQLFGTRHVAHFAAHLFSS